MNCFMVGLLGHPPVRANSLDEIRRNFGKAPLIFSPRISPDVQGLVRDLLNPDQNKRPSASEALKHPSVKRYLPVINHPVSAQDRQLLIQVFLRSTNNGHQHHFEMPDEISSGSRNQPSKNPNTFPQTSNHGSASSVPHKIGSNSTQALRSPTAENQSKPRIDQQTFFGSQPNGVIPTFAVPAQFMHQPILAAQTAMQQDFSNRRAQTLNATPWQPQSQPFVNPLVDPSALHGYIAPPTWLPQPQAQFFVAPQVSPVSWVTSPNRPIQLNMAIQAQQIQPPSRPQSSAAIWGNTVISAQPSQEFPLQGEKLTFGVPQADPQKKYSIEPQSSLQSPNALRAQSNDVYRQPQVAIQPTFSISPLNPTIRSNFTSTQNNQITVAPEPRSAVQWQNSRLSEAYNGDNLTNYAIGPQSNFQNTQITVLPNTTSENRTVSWYNVNNSPR